LREDRYEEGNKHKNLATVVIKRRIFPDIDRFDFGDFMAKGIRSIEMASMSRVSDSIRLNF